MTPETSGDTLKASGVRLKLSGATLETSRVPLELTGVTPETSEDKLKASRVTLELSGLAPGGVITACRWCRGPGLQGLPGVGIVRSASLLLAL